MKYITYFLMAASLSHAATLDFTNNNGFSTNQLTYSDANNTVVTSGTVNIGYFDGVTDTQLGAITDVSEYNSYMGNFVELTNASISLTSAFGNDFYSFSVQDTSTNFDDSSDTWGGQNIYFTFNDGLDAFIYKFDTPLSSSEPATQSFTLGVDAGELILGNVGADETIGTVNSATFKSAALVPEPSSLVLLALGGLSMISRRKR